MACEDGQQVEAHKVILAASSPFFQKLLRRSKHPHPLIYMRGMKYEDLLAIVDFLYLGEANVYQENLDSFLAIAEELQLKGLMGKSESDVTLAGIDTKYSLPAPDPVNNAKMQESKRQTPRSQTERMMDRRVAVQADYFSGDLMELEEKVKSMMEKSPNPYVGSKKAHPQKADVCKVCGKEGMASAIKDHIEANHLEGISIPCNLCEKIFRSRNSFNKHKRQHQLSII